MDRKNMKRLLIFDHVNMTIEQKRQLNPPSWNGRFRDEVRKEYPDYTLK